MVISLLLLLHPLLLLCSPTKCDEEEDEEGSLNSGDDGRECDESGWELFCFSNPSSFVLLTVPKVHSRSVDPQKNRHNYLITCSIL